MEKNRNRQTFLKSSKVIEFFLLSFLGTQIKKSQQSQSIKSKLELQKSRISLRNIKKNKIIKIIIKVLAPSLLLLRQFNSKKNWMKRFKKSLLFLLSSNKKIISFNKKNCNFSKKTLWLKLATLVVRVLFNKWKWKIVLNINKHVFRLILCNLKKSKILWFFFFLK